MNKWESYILYHGNSELENFWEEYYTSKPHQKVLFLLGKGFDPRMNNILALLLKNTPELNLQCIAFDFQDANRTGDSQKLYDKNVATLSNMSSQYGFQVNNIDINTELVWEKRIAIMSRQLSEFDLSEFDDVILDVSSLPRAFYFNIAKVLYFKMLAFKNKNLFFAVSENVEIDSLIEKVKNDNEVEPLRGFKSILSIESNLDRVNILIPLIGEKKVNMLRNIYNNFKPSDMFPVLPFPSKNPRRSDSLMLEYHGFFTEKKFTEPQNITYADEQNPFEVYRIVSSLMEEHKKTLSPISDHVCFGLAVLTSKLLSLGALLVGLEYNDCVAIYNVSSTSYNIKNVDMIEASNKKSEPFLMWIIGEAYNE